MADQFASVDAFGMKQGDDQYHETFMDSYSGPALNANHAYSNTIQDLDLNAEHLPRRYSAASMFDDYGHDTLHDQMEHNEALNKNFLQYAARRKIAQIMTNIRRDKLAQNAGAAMAEQGVYQKVVRPKSRKQWVRGTHVLVQRDKSTQWFHGTIVNIYDNAMGKQYVSVHFRCSDWFITRKVTMCCVCLLAVKVRRC